MKRRAVLLGALALVLAGCGDPSGTTEGSDAGTGSTAGSGSDSESRPAPEWTEVAIVSATAAGGESATAPTRLDSPESLEAFVSQFERGELAQEVQDAVAAADVPAGHVLLGAVVAVGCDVPPEISIGLKGGLSIQAVGLEKLPQKECFAPITSVGIVTVDKLLL